MIDSVKIYKIGTGFVDLSVKLDIGHKSNAKQIAWKVMDLLHAYYGDTSIKKDLIYTDQEIKGPLGSTHVIGVPKSPEIILATPINQVLPCELAAQLVMFMSHMLIHDGYCKTTEEGYKMAIELIEGDGETASRVPLVKYIDILMAVLTNNPCFAYVKKDIGPRRHKRHR